MSNLVLNSLEIRSFRGFRHLKIEHLGRVNLIVGKNNVGKTALLEALRLYAAKSSPVALLEILGFADQTPESDRSLVEMRLPSLKYLFYGRKDVTLKLEPIQIGPIDAPDERLSTSIQWSMYERDERGTIVSRLLEPEEYNAATQVNPMLLVKLGNREAFRFSLDWISPGRPFKRESGKNIGIFRDANGLDTWEMSRLWDSIALTDLEQEAVAALRIIAPGVERLNFIADEARPLERVPIVKVADIAEPLPLSNLGDGMRRMLGIALALVNAKDGFLLVDEIENGLHYSVLPDLWQMIFQLARRLNVQVFATTHSWDCIEGFQQAAQEDTQVEGLLIRLDARKDGIAATLFDERRLGIAAREQIEVR